ncbi:MAG: homoprotocatechuate degradation operon regulator HpaR [Woeseiaceae bacterium]|nr:homoprotocatechuate degradation operon regulator HpaR [Woeseiaceae bacterium]
MANKNTRDLTLREFDRSLPMTLLKAREAVMRKFMPSLREHDLSAQQWRVLRALNEVKSRDASEIAEQCSILMPSLSRILRNLEDRKLIRRKSCPDDQRRSLISITAKGRGLVDRIAPVSEERYDEIARRFGRKNLADLYDQLGKLIECLED